MADFNAPYLLVLDSKRSYRTAISSVDIGAWSQISFNFTFSGLSSKESLLEFAYLLIPISSIIDPGGFSWRQFSPLKSFDSRGSGTESVQPFINTVGQIYPTLSSPSRPPRALAQNRPFRICAAFGLARDEAIQGQPVQESGQIYPQFVPLCDKVRDWILPAELGNIRHILTSSLFDRTALIEPVSGFIDVDGLDAFIHKTWILQASTKALFAQGKVAYLLDPESIQINASALVQTLAGQSALLKRAMVLSADALIEQVNGNPSNADESIYFRDWARQTNGWDREFSVDWWAD